MIWREKQLISRLKLFTLGVTWMDMRVRKKFEVICAILIFIVKVITKVLTRV